jgi:hypothetical protein
VIKNGQITENGTFRQLMKNKGHLSLLIGEHVQIIDEEEEPELVNHLNDSSNGISVTTHAPLNNDQINNRRRLSLSRHVKATDENLPIHIENCQLTLIGGEHSRKDSIKVFERNRMSIVTIDNEEEVVPSDAEPMKLVLEDQSVNYKQVPFFSYLKAGKGVVLTLMLFVLFFLVHGVRIGSGML